MKGTDILKTMDQRNNIEEYNYDLPAERIALHPLADRSRSKLLVYNEGVIRHQVFDSLPVLLKDQLIVFNDSKVIPARIFAQTESGYKIEIFLLNPVKPVSYKDALHAPSGVIWKCQVGHKKKWKKHEKLKAAASVNDHSVELTMHYADEIENHIVFEWQGSETFADIVQIFGVMPLPPYIKRAITENDKWQYQTVYSKQEGSVAAPTAGLHFTDDILQQLMQNGNSISYVTLHVSAGTFKPITEKDISRHSMHAETFSFSTHFLLELIEHAGNITAVGTTSMRVIESVYWLAVQSMEHADSLENIHLVEQNCWHDQDIDVNAKELLQYYYNDLIQKGITEVIAETRIFITPGYSFRLVNKLITNFHMPGSTLICLVAAFIGNDWKHIYDEALKNNYRFLSYGDSSLLMPGTHPENR